MSIGQLIVVHTSLTLGARNYHFYFYGSTSGGSKDKEIIAF
jgi:hypothetical protein